MNPTRKALYTALSGDATLTALLSSSTAIYHQLAPQDAAYPLIVFHKQSGTPAYQMTAHVQWDLWSVKAIDQAGSASRAEDIAARITAVLDDAELTIDDHRLLYLRRDSDIDYSEADGATVYRHCGAMFRVVTEPA